MPDETLTCVECTKTFLHTERDQEFYLGKDPPWTPPKRCRPCRTSRAAASGATADPPEKRVCRDCSTQFDVTAKEKAFFSSRGLSIPVRCKPCREEKKARNLSQGA